MGEGYYPSDTPYEELQITVPSGEQRNLPGLWNYLQILGVTKTVGGGPTNDDQEVSFNGGKTWTRLRRGIQVRIGTIDPATGLATGTTVLKVRNEAADSIDLVIAMGYGDIKDARLTINTDITAFNVDFADPSAFKTSLDDIDTRILALARVVYDPSAVFYSLGWAASASVTSVLVAGVLNVNGILVRAGASFMCRRSAGNDGKSFVSSQAGIYLVGCFMSHFNTSGVNDTLDHFHAVTDRDYLIPASFPLELTFGGEGSAAFSYVVL